MKERLQKVLARGGLGSRRYCETLIAERRVRVNGAVADEPGARVDPVADEVSVDGVTIAAEPPVYYLLNKPTGYVCSSRPLRDERSVLALVAARGGERLFSVGRLDEDSGGALILTNDGEFCNRLTHPRYGIPKSYRVVVRGRVEGKALDRLRKGVHLAEGRTAPARIHVVKRTRELSVLRVTLREGKNRHLRRVFAKLGFPVKEITRISIGPLRLGRLAEGEWRPLRGAEVSALLEDTDPAARRLPRPTRETT